MHEECWFLATFVAFLGAYKWLEFWDANSYFTRIIGAHILMVFASWCGNFMALWTVMHAIWLWIVVCCSIGILIGLYLEEQTSDFLCKITQQESHMVEGLLITIFVFVSLGIALYTLF
jgi:hypothetical protein